MKYTIHYSRKVKAGQPYEMIEIGLELEGDTGTDGIADKFREAKDRVDQWISEEKDPRKQN